MPFLEDHPECEIQSPECTFVSTVIHHTNGRENERLLDQRDWKASCARCNIVVEEKSKWAYDNGHKLYKHQLNSNNGEYEPATVIKSNVL